MKQWNGLLKKEWVTMREWLYGNAVIAILLMLVASFGLSMLIEGKVNVFLILGIVIIIWIITSIFLPVVILLNSLWKDWNRPDLWLHSTSSIYKLFGSKSIFAIIVGAVNVLIPTSLLLIYALFWGSPLFELSFGELVFFVWLLVFAFFTASIMIMCTGLFFGVFYQLIKPVVKGFTVPITVILFVILAQTFERVKVTTIYQKVAAFGPIGDPTREKFYIERGNFFIGPTEPVVYTGDVLLSLLFILLLFVVSTVLFEKKVRL